MKIASLNHKTYLVKGQCKQLYVKYLILFIQNLSQLLNEPPSSGNLIYKLNEKKFTVMYCC